MKIFAPSTRALSAGYDPWLLLAVAALLSVGVVMVYSASIASDSATLRINVHYLLRQVAHIGLGAVALWVAAALNTEWLQAASRALLLLAFALLILVVVPGVGMEVNGSLRWLAFAGAHFQPSELMKVAIVVYFADYFARKQALLRRFQVGVLNVGVVLGGVAWLLLLEPDFGSATVIVLTVAAMMFLAGVRWWHFCVGLSAVTAALTAVAWMAPYRVERLLSHQNPWADPFDGGFQLVQALIAIGRGEWFGAGLGSSIQKLFYLPHAGTDFLVAVIGEELGAAGIFAILMLFALLLWRAFAIARRAHYLGQRFGGFLAQGIGLLLALQAAIHIGVNTGLLPTKGLTLPLVSYGGSSMLSNMLAVGLLLAVDRRCRADLGRRVQRPGGARHRRAAGCALRS